MTTLRIPVWDLAVRLFHWSLVAFFTIAYLTGDENDTLHVYSGYIVLGLVLFRIFWGIVGTRHARFSDFVSTPRQVVAYLGGLVSRKPKHYLGHNPAAGWMIVALLASLLATGYSGLKVYGAEGHGPLAANTELVLVQSTAYADEGEVADRDGDKQAENFWEEVHEFFANLTLVLVFMHIAGVFVSSWLHRENLVKAMITGRKTING